MSLASPASTLEQQLWGIFLEHRGHAGFSTLPLNEQVGCTGEDIADPLSQELDPLGVPLPDVLPGIVPLHHLFPLHPGTLSSHGHCSACLLFLH